MNVHSISATLDLDTNSFTLRVREAGGVTRSLKKDIESLNKAVKDSATALDGSIRAAVRYVESNAAISRSKQQMKAAQDAFLAALVREQHTLGMSADQLRSYNAGQLGLTMQTRELIAAIAEKEEWLRKLAAEERAEAQAATLVAEAEERRIRTGQEIIASLEREILVMKEGSDALLIQRAQIAGVEAETRRLIIAKGELIAAQERERLATLATPKEKFIADLQRQVLATKEASIASKGGAVALAEYKAGLVGASAAAAPLIAELRLLEQSFVRTGHAAHVNNGAVREFNVIIHELVSGRLRQAIGSFSILLGQLGLATNLILGLTVTIGLLYSIAHPIGEAAKHMEELNKQSQQLGVSIAFLQTLGVAATLTGTKTEKLVAGIGHLDAAFGRAKGGSKAAQQAFEQLGISMNDNLTNEELTNKLIAGWDKLADGPGKVAIATRLFGRSGVELIPILNTLAKNMDEVNHLTKEYDLTNQKAVSSGLELAEHFKRSAIAAKGLGLAIMESIGPSVVKLLDSFNAVSKSVINFLRDGDRLRSIFDTIKTAGVALATFFATKMTLELIMMTTKAIMASQAFFALSLSMAMAGEAGIATSAFQVIGNVMSALAAGTIPALRMAFASLWAVMAANPILLIAGLVAALVTGGYMLTQELKRNAEAAVGLAKADERLAQTKAALTAVMDKNIMMTKEEITQRLSSAKEQLNDAQATFLNAQAKLALLTASKKLADEQNKKAMMYGGYMAGMSARPGASFDQAKINAQTKLVKDAEEDFNALSKMIAGLEERMKHPFKPGTTLDIPAAAIKEKVDPIRDAISNLKEQLGSLQGKLDETGSVSGKYQAALDSVTGSLKNATSAQRELILAAAAQIDQMKAYAFLKDEADKQTASAEAVHDHYMRIIAGANAAKVATDEYRASLEKNLRLSGAYKGKDGKTGGDLANTAATGQAQKVAEEQAIKSLDELRQKQRETQISAAELWAQYTAGMEHTDAGLAKLKASLDKYVRDQTEAGKAAAQQLRDDIISGYQSGRSAEGLTKMKDEIKKINTDLEMDTVKKAKETAQAQIDAMKEVIFYAGMSAEQRKMAEDEFARYVQAKNDELKAHSKFGQMARQWGDVMGNMKDASASWMESFANDLSEGKFNFADFAKSVIADIAKIVTKAILAKYVLEPLMSAFGLGGGVSGGSTGGSTPSFGSGASGGMKGGMSAPMSIAHSGGMQGEWLKSFDNPSHYVGAPKFHSGLMPGEIRAIIKDDEGVFTKGQMKALGQRMDGSGAGAAPPVTINLKNESGTSLDADHAGTKFDGESFVLDVVISHLGRPGTLRNAVKNSK